MMRKRIGLLLLSLILWTGAVSMVYAVEGDENPSETVGAGEDDDKEDDDEDDNDESNTTAKTIAEIRQDAKEELEDYKVYLEPNDDQASRIDSILKEARSGINKMTTEDGIDSFVTKKKEEMYQVVNPSSDDSDDRDDEEENDNTPTTYSTNSKLVICDNWATPTAVAGQTVNVVIPITNMDVYDVTDIFVEPVLAEDAESFPFEIEKSSYMVQLDRLPGSGSIADPLERRQEITYVWKTRKDAVTGYKRLSFEVSFTNANGEIENATLELYINVEGKSSGNNQSVPRVIVTGYKTEPEIVHAGETFTLKVMLENTSEDTEVGNMKIEFEASEEGRDEKEVSAAFIPVAGSNTLFLNSIPAGQSKEITIDMTAKSDLAQNSYQLGMVLDYEDDTANAYTTSSSLSIPVKQDAKFDVSSIEVMPSTLIVGSEANVMFSIYNTGKTSLYNVTVSFEADSISGGDTFVGNIETGATGNVDAMVSGAAVTTDDGTVKIKISYEDVNGEASSVERTMTLIVEEEDFSDISDDFSVGEEEHSDNSGILSVLLILILLVAGVTAGVFGIRKWKANKKEKISRMLEEDKSYFDEMEKISLDEPEEKK